MYLTRVAAEDVGGPLQDMHLSSFRGANFPYFPPFSEAISSARNVYSNMYSKTTQLFKAHVSTLNKKLKTDS